MRLGSFALALAVGGAAAMATPASAAVINGSGLLVTIDIDDYFFTVTTAGLVDIRVVEDVLDFSDFDTQINLYVDDGNLTFDDFIANDDDGAGFGGSALSLVLAAGDYLLRIGTHDFFSGSLDGTNGDGHHQHTDYVLTITGDVATGAVALPEPGVLGLMGLGLAGLGLVRRRRR